MTLTHGVIMRFVWSVLISLTVASTAMATEIDVAGGVEYFKWEEFSDSGSKYLDETGQRNYIELVGTDPLESDWLIEFGGRFYSGTVEYDGQTISGIPVSTDTDYNGARLELGFAHYDFGGGIADGGALSLRFALGLEQWRRSLRDTKLSDGTPVTGYVERYTSTYARLGATYHFHEQWSFGAGVKAPFHTKEEVDIGGVTITLHPEGQLSLFAGIEIPINNGWGLSVDYDTYRFAKSDLQAGYYQPKSTQDTIGLALHYRF